MIQRHLLFNETKIDNMKVWEWEEKLKGKGLKLKKLNWDVLWNFEQFGVRWSFDSWAEEFYCQRNEFGWIKDAKILIKLTHSISLRSFKISVYSFQANF